jgi:hypothetical protein
MDGEKTAAEVFDVPLMGRFFALSDLWSACHGVAWQNLRFYYNPVNRACWSRWLDYGRRAVPVVQPDTDHRPRVPRQPDLQRTRTCARLRPGTATRDPAGVRGRLEQKWGAQEDS